MKPRKDKKPRSFDELRQRELAWLLYTSEGRAANFRHARRVNCVTFTGKEDELLARM